MTFPDFNQSADPELYGRVIDLSLDRDRDDLSESEREDTEAAYASLLDQYHAAERGRASTALGGIEL